MRRIAIGVVVAAMALAACGGGSSSKSSSPGSATTTTTAGSGSSTGNDEFSQLISKAKTADFKATYTTADGKSITLAQDGTGKEAFVSDSSVVISDGTSTISCDGATSSATCTNLGSTGATMLAGLTAIFTTAYTSLAGLNSTVYNGHTSTESIAGQDASCVTVKASDFAGGLGSIASKITGDASVTSCVDAKSGYLLKYSTSVSGKTTDEFLATAAGPSSPSDFVPPSTPVTTPTIPNVSIPGVSIPTP